MGSGLQRQCSIFMTLLHLSIISSTYRRKVNSTILMLVIVHISKNHSRTILTSYSYLISCFYFFHFDSSETVARVTTATSSDECREVLHTVVDSSLADATRSHACNDLAQTSRRCQTVCTTTTGRTCFHRPWPGEGSLPIHTCQAQNLCDRMPIARAVLK